MNWPVVQGPQSTRESHVLRGKGARSLVPRSSQGWWQPAADRFDPVDILENQAAARLAELVPVRNGRMAASPFAFYRGSAAVMAADLATTSTTGITAQLCGDAHLSNFGGYASPDRHLVFDLNDFDETMPGPWEWDVKRLMTSLEIAGRSRDFDAGERRGIVLAAAAAYREAMREFAALSTLEVWYSRLTVTDIRSRWGDAAGRKAMGRFDRQIRKAMTKDNARAASRLTETVDGRTRLLSDPPLLIPVAELLDDVEMPAFELIVTNALRSYRRSLSGGRRHLLEQFRYIDTARKVVGVGSVGTRAWVVLMLGIDDDPLVLQLKEARESVLAPFVGRSQYNNQGQRVVVGQEHLQASSDTFLGWNRSVALDGVTRDFYIRQLWDWKISADVERQSPPTMTLYGQMCGWTLARGHARSGDRVAIAAYLGRGEVFDESMTEFAVAYADQNDLDHQRWLDAVDAGRVAVVPDV